MWTIVSISTNPPRTSILFKPGTEIINPTGALAGNYVLAFPGLGYVTLIDNGNAVPGGDWSVQFSGAIDGAGNWFYGGGGRASITVDAGGAYSISGGSGADVEGNLTPWGV